MEACASRMDRVQWEIYPWRNISKPEELYPIDS
jgi:hypothetical protein